MIDKEFISKLTNIVSNYLESINDQKIAEYFPPEELQKRLPAPIENKSVCENELFDLIKNYLKYSVNTASYRFCNQLYNGLSPAALAGEIIAVVTNTSMATYEIAPAATVIEKELVSEFAGLAGFDKNTADGIMVTGGSNANMIAMMCARHKADSNTKRAGVNGLRLKAFVSEQCHYSLGTAAAILGIGTDNLVLVKSDTNGRMIPKELEKEITYSIANGDKPFFVGATSGTTVIGAFDPLKEIGLIADKFGMWFHVDGAWGGAALLSSQYKHLLAGVNRADSFSIDAHKLMGIPLMASFIIVSDDAILKQTNYGGGTDYIFHEHAYENMDTGTKSIQCGRRVDALKVWLTWKFYGRTGYENLINQVFRNRDCAVELIKNGNKFRLIYDPQFLNVCFGVIPAKKIEEYNDFIFAIRKRVVDEGKYLVNHSLLKSGEACIRLIVSNPEFDSYRLAEFFSYLAQIAEQIENDF